MALTCWDHKNQLESQACSEYLVLVGAGVCICVCVYICVYICVCVCEGLHTHTNHTHLGLRWMVEAWVSWVSPLCSQAASLLQTFVAANGVGASAVAATAIGVRLAPIHLVANLLPLLVLTVAALHTLRLELQLQVKCVHVCARLYECIPVCALV